MRRKEGRKAGFKLKKKVLLVEETHRVASPYQGGKEVRAEASYNQGSPCVPNTRQQLLVWTGRNPNHRVGIITTGEEEEEREPYDTFFPASLCKRGAGVEMSMP